MNEIEESRRVAQTAFEAGETPEATLRLLKERFAIRSVHRRIGEHDEGTDRPIPAP